MAIHKFTELWQDHLMENKENWVRLDSDGVNEVPQIQDSEPDVFEPESTEPEEND